MAIILDGTNGITNVNGTAAVPAITGSDTDTGLYFGTNTLGLSTNGSAALTIDTSQNATVVGTLAMSSSFLRNRIINGDMRIDQRNAGASVTITTSNQYTLDRWQGGSTVSSKFSVQQNAGSVTPPAGFTNYLGCTSLAATSLGASDYYVVQQKIEGLNISDLAWGTASAVTVTLSFWVRSSLTGTFGGVIQNSAGNRSYPFSYTITAANTWEKETITIAGDTSGTWLTTNGIGMYLLFSLGTGSTFSGTAGSWSGSNFLSATGATSVVGTNGATFYITGVQLEVGTSATPFERRMYTTELQLCQRYCPMVGPVVADSFSAVGYTISTTQGRVVFQFPVTARTAPTGITVTNPTGFALAPPFARAASAVAFSESNTQYASVDVTVTGLTANQPTTLRIGSSGGCKIEFTGCEL